ncbi:MAG: hypothetical protein AB7S26_39560 [Sandaracinaceae bacterium]
MRAIAYVALALLVAIEYGRAASFSLVFGWDDGRFLVDDPLVTEPSFEHFVAIFAAPHFEAYQPLHLLSYWLDAPWLGVDGPALHVVNLILFALAAIAVFEASRALLARYRGAGAEASGSGFFGGLIVAALVCAHPIQVESAVWITGRKDILALGFGALAVWAHVRSARPFDRMRLFSLLAFGAAALSKTTILPLPLVLIAADVWLVPRDAPELRARVRSAVIAQLPTLLVATALGVVTLLLWRDAELIAPRALEPVRRIGLVGATLTHALVTLVWPSSLSPLYPVDRGAGYGPLMLLAGPVLLALAIAWTVRSKNRGAAFTIASFLAFWLPVSNVIPLYYQWQDRYLALPLWPLAIGIGLLVEGLLQRRSPSPINDRRIVLGIAMAAVAALAARGAQYTAAWRDDLTLFQHATSVQPSSFYAWLSLGHARARRDDYEGASAAYERAVEVANLEVAHVALFRVRVLEDEHERHLSPSRADELAARFQAADGDAQSLRTLALEVAEAGYRKAVFLALDYSFAIQPLADDVLEHAAVVQITRGNEWLARYYTSRLRHEPINPELRARFMPAPDEDDEAEHDAEE